VADRAQAMQATLAGLSPLEARVLAAVRAALPSQTRVVVSSEADGMRLSIQGVRVRARWAAEGWLAQVRRALEGNRVELVVARRLSPAARALLSAAGVGWLDETGAAEVAMRSLVVSRTGDPSRLGPREARWTRSTLAVAEALLCADTPATVSAMRAASGLSAGSCTTALASLADLGYLKAASARGRRSARTMVDSRQLLAAYVDATSEMPPAIELPVAIDLSGAFSTLAVAGVAWDAARIPWALSGRAAASIITPSGSAPTTVRVYLRVRAFSELERAAQMARLVPTAEGGCVLACEPTVATCGLAIQRRGLRVAPWARVYADLLTGHYADEPEAERVLESVFRRGVPVLRPPGDASRSCPGRACDARRGAQAELIYETKPWL